MFQNHQEVYRNSLKNFYIYSYIKSWPIKASLIIISIKFDLELTLLFRLLGLVQASNLTQDLAQLIQIQ